MNTECEFLYISLIIYMSFNAYTDFKYLKTKNVWHLFFLTGILIYAGMNQELVKVMLMLLVSVGIGFLIRKIPSSSFGAGDIKMIGVIGAGFALFPSNDLPLVMIFRFIITYLITSLIILSVCRVIQARMNKQKKREQLKWGTYLIQEKYIETPEAIPLFMASLFLPYFF